MRKHQFDAPYPDGRCIHCDTAAGLDKWQLQSMPMDMARCPSGKYVWFWEILLYPFRGGGINCWFKKREEVCPNCGYNCTGYSIYCTKHPDGPQRGVKE